VLSLLAEIEAFPKNGFELWGATHFVRLGETPRHAAALCIITELAQHFATINRTGTSVIPQRMWLDLDSHPSSCARPALISHLHKLIATSNASTAEARYVDGLQQLHRKLLFESSQDAYNALLRVPLEVRLHLLAAAHGEPFASSSCLDVGDQFAAAIGDHNGKLQPPYPHLFSAWMDATGRVLPKDYKEGLEWIGLARDNLTYVFTWYDNLKQNTFSSADDMAVVDSCIYSMLIAQRICPDEPQCCNTFEALPVIHLVLKLLDDEWLAGGKTLPSPSRTKFNKLKAKFNKLEATDTASPLLGILFCVWLRHLEAHRWNIPQAFRLLSEAGLTPSVVHQIAAEGARAIDQLWEASGEQ
jgi:hypothetical protein